MQALQQKRGDNIGGTHRTCDRDDIYVTVKRMVMKLRRAAAAAATQVLKRLK